MNAIPFNGVHGQTFVCSNAIRTTHLYLSILGLKLLKRTVHHLDPRLPVMIFGFTNVQGVISSQTVTLIE